MSHRRLCIPAAVLVALTLAACGSEGKAALPSPVSPTTTAPAETPEGAAPTDPETDQAPEEGEPGTASGANTPSPRTTPSTSEAPEAPEASDEDGAPTDTSGAEPSDTEPSDTSAPTEEDPESTPSTTDAEQPTSAATTPSRAAPNSTPAQVLLWRSPSVRTEKEGRAGSCTNGCTGSHPGPASIAGESYPQSYLIEASRSGSRSTVTWDVSRQCSVFEMTAGVLDGQAQQVRVRFTVSTDRGTPQELGTVGVAEPLPVKVDIRNVALVTIAANVEGAAPNQDVDVVLGNPTVTCSPGR